jgi:prolyl-tRNA synthetase
VRLLRRDARSAARHRDGHTFKPGTRYSAAMGATFADEEGVTHPLLLGIYGIRWPRSIAPYEQQLVVLGTDEATTAAAESIYAALAQIPRSTTIAS